VSRTITARQFVSQRGDGDNLADVTTITTDELDPRVARTRAAISEAARDLLVNEGLEAVTQQRVAERSGLGRATVYRHFPERTDLIHEAVQLELPEAPEPTGVLHTDLLRLITTYGTHLSERTSTCAMAALIAEAEHDPAMSELKHRIHGQVSAPARRLLARAAKEGRLRPGLKVDLAETLVLGAMLHRRFFEERVVDRRFCEAVVDAVLLPAEG